MASPPVTSGCVSVARPVATPTNSRSVKITCDCAYTVDGCASSSMKMSDGALLDVSGAVTRKRNGIRLRARRHARAAA